ncbi:MAG: putative bifunctional diguanylate cyclase/phosphodiesterase [Planctomycetota bacterium]|jgi:diguanylate cyclase (GGDEF)-like protein
MRIHHHVSIILFVAIAGAIGLALAVGVFLAGLERAARESGKASEQYHQIESLVAHGQELLETINALSPESARESFAFVERALELAVTDLAKLRHALLLVDPSAVEEPLRVLERTFKLSRQLAAEGRSGPRAQDEVALLRENAAIYVARLGEVAATAAEAAGGRDRTLARRRKIIMLTIGLICIVYLAVIERVRHWTTRRLIFPVQKLADAAIQAMEGEEAFPGLEQGSTEELNTLARVLASFVDTLKAKVRERTVQVERQKEHLEREVAVRRRAEDQLRHAAFHDKLTGLCNRDLLLDRLERCIERARRNDDYNFAVLFLDIDRFKEVNDSLGHFVGDQLLISIAERLQHCLRSTDSVTRVESNTIARIGGDEFVILLDGIGVRADASLVAERVQEVLAEPFHLHGQEVFTTASIGIAFNEIECDKADHLLRDADTAMYYAKAAGKARHEVFNKRMHDQAMSRLKLGNDLRRAVENEEFSVGYQPIVSLRTGRLSGFEVLARWAHPERGNVSPVEFIAHAEETGQIVPLGHWVLEQACRQLRAWQDDVDKGLKLSVNVNVSKRQVAEPGMVDRVQRTLRSTGLAGTHLKLEITESVIMENPDSITEVLERLKQIGVEIHMDDFGTGYSSLSYLHRFPLDVLKIDRAFMGTLSANNDYADVVRTVVAMAHILNMQVTVEGVETQDQLTQLMGLDCDYAQGYYFSPPLDAEAAREIIVSQPTWLKAA